MSIKVDNLVRLAEEKGSEYKSYFKNEVLKEINPREFSIQEVTAAFLGKNGNWKEELVNIKEAGGQVTNATAALHVNAWTSTMFGLIESISKEAYSRPQFIGDGLVPTTTRVPKGGKLIRMSHDGQAGYDLALGEKYPLTTEKEIYIGIPDWKRNGSAIAISEEMIMLDLTDTVIASAEDAGYALRRNKENNILDTMLGIVNPYSFNGVASNTYGTAVGTPAYTNLVTTNALVTLDDINDAILVLQSMADPITGFEIDVTQKLALIVPPALVMKANSAVHATQVRFGDGASNTFAEYAQNPLPNNITVYSNQMVKNRTSSDSTWFLGNPSKAFQYFEAKPFEIKQEVISFEQAREDIVLAYVARQWGICGVTEPRYMVKCTA